MRQPSTEGWKERLRATEFGYFELADEETRGVPVRVFMTPTLLEELEDSVYPQIITASRFPASGPS